MVDFHSHILPGIDDGSDSVSTSLEMLKLTAEQGIGQIVATPHFYPDRENPDSFLERRNRAVERLASKLHKNSPRIYVGAEVAYFSGMGHSDQIRKLTISGSNTILVEMPFSPWSESVTDELKRLEDSYGLQVVIAHIERYIGYQRKDMLDTLLENGIMIQTNASVFTDFFKKNKYLSLVQDGKIHFLGSDCHNLTTRPQTLGKAMSEIKKKLGDRSLDNIENIAHHVLEKAISVN